MCTRLSLLARVVQIAGGCHGASVADKQAAVIHTGERFRLFIENDVYTGVLTLIIIYCRNLILRNLHLWTRKYLLMDDLMCLFDPFG